MPQDQNENPVPEDDDAERADRPGGEPVPPGNPQDYSHPAAGTQAVEERAQALRSLFARLDSEPLKTLAKWAQHFFDDRVVRSWEAYKDTRAYHGALEEERGILLRKRAEELQAALDERIEAFRMRDQGASERIAAVEEELSDLQEAATRAVAATGHRLTFPDPISHEEIESTKATHRNMGRLRRNLADLLDRVRGQDPSDKDADRNAVELRSEALLDEFKATRLGGRVGPAQIVRDLSLGNLPVLPEEAAQELGVPFYLGCEITEEHVESMKGQMEGDKLESIRSWVHWIDRRYYSPLIHQGKVVSISVKKNGFLKSLFGLTTFGLILGLFLGVSLGLALGWLTPLNIRPSLEGALSPASWLDQIKDLFQHRNAVAVPAKVEAQGAELARSVGGILVLALWALGYAVAYVSRYAVMIPFLTLGETIAAYRLDVAADRVFKWPRLLLAWVVPLIVLLTVVYAEVRLESSAFKRISNGPELEEYTKHRGQWNVSHEVADSSGEGGGSAPRKLSTTTPDVVDRQLAEEAATAAAFLVLAGYLLYGAGEGFLRGRDARFRVAIVHKVWDMTTERERSVGITAQITKDALGAVGLYDAKRTCLNGLYMDRSMALAKIERLEEARAKLDRGIAESVIDVSNVAAVQKAYSDFLGASIEFDKLMDELLVVTRRDVRGHLAAKDAEQAAEAERARREAKRVKQAEEDADRLRDQVKRMINAVLSGLESEIMAAVDARKSIRGGYFQRLWLRLAQKPQANGRTLDEMVAEFESVIKRMRTLLSDVRSDAGPQPPDPTSSGASVL